MGKKLFFEAAVDIPFALLTEFFVKLEKLSEQQGSAQIVGQKSKYKIKFETFEKLRNMVSTSTNDLYQLYRLILPELDTVRGNYGLKEQKLANALVQACNLGAEDEAAKAAKNWKNNGIKFAGRFTEVMEEYLYKNNCKVTSGKLSLGAINDQLDKLVQAGDLKGKSEILRWLIMRCHSTEMKWMTRIILRDMKLHTSADTVLRYFHKDALDLYNKTMNLKKVCLELKDPNVRPAIFDIQPGFPVRPQLAQRAASPEAAFKKYQHPKTKCTEFVMEVKFDGERIQLHVNLSGNNNTTQNSQAPSSSQSQPNNTQSNSKINYFSRAAIDHGSSVAGYSVMNQVVRKQLIEKECILDGELIVFNKKLKKFEAFGWLKSATHAARSGKNVDEVIQYEGNEEGVPVGDLEIVYIAFDVLYVGSEGGSVINRSLRERHDLLRQMVRGAPEEGIPIGAGKMRGRIVLLLPNQPLIQDLVFSKIGTTLPQMKTMFEEAVDRQEEGIVVKDLESQWRIGERSKASWMKIKPDYIHNHEIDALIIGGLYGQGRHRGGVLSEYLLALADKPAGSVRPQKFVTFCRVGTGLTNEQREELEEKLKPILENRSRPPAIYKTTGNAKERPTHWVIDPQKSVVVQIKADIRAIVSKVYATDYSLRFPRIERLRPDKSANDVMSVQELEELVQENQGALMNYQQKASQAQKNSEGSPKQPRRQSITVAPQFALSKPSQTDHSTLNLFPARTYVCFLNYGQIGKNNAEQYTMILGAKVSMNWREGMMVFAGEPAGSKFDFNLKAEKYSVLKIDYLVDCVKEKKLLPLLPRYYWFVTRRQKQRQMIENFQEEINSNCVEFDAVGDSLFYYLNRKDIETITRRYPKQELSSYNVTETINLEGFEAYQFVQSELGGWGRTGPLNGCCIMVIPQLNNFMQKQFQLQSPTQIVSSSLKVIDVIDGVAELNKCFGQKSSLSIQVSYFKSVVRKLGGFVCENSSEQLLSHIVVVPEYQNQVLNWNSNNNNFFGEQILKGIESSCGKISLELKRRLIGGGVKIISSKWIEKCLDEDEKVNIQQFQIFEEQVQFEQWPWKQFGLDSDEENEKQQKMKKTVRKTTTTTRKTTGRKRKILDQGNEEQIQEEKMVPKKRQKRSYNKKQQNKEDYQKQQPKRGGKSKKVLDLVEEEDSGGESQDAYESDFIDDQDVQEVYSEDADYVQHAPLSESEADDFYEMEVDEDIQSGTSNKIKSENLKNRESLESIESIKCSNNNSKQISGQNQVKTKQKNKKQKSKNKRDSILCSVVSDMSDSDGGSSCDEGGSEGEPFPKSMEIDDDSNNLAPVAQKQKLLPQSYGGNKKRTSILASVIDDVSDEEQTNNLNQQFLSRNKKDDDVFQKSKITQSNDGVHNPGSVQNESSTQDLLNKLQQISAQLSKNKQTEKAPKNVIEQNPNPVPVVRKEEKEAKGSGEGQKRRRFADKISGLLD